MGNSCDTELWRWAYLTSWNLSNVSDFCFPTKMGLWVLLRKTSVSIIVLAINCLTCVCPPSSLWFTLWFCRAFDFLWIKEGAAPLCVQDLQTKCGGRIPGGSEYCAVWGRRDLGAYAEDSWEQWQLLVLLGPSERKDWREKSWGIKEEAFSSLAVVFKSKARDNPQKCDFLAHNL